MVAHVCNTMIHCVARLVELTVTLVSDTFIVCEKYHGISWLKQSNLLNYGPGREGVIAYEHTSKVEATHIRKHQFRNGIW